MISEIACLIEDRAEKTSPKLLGRSISALILPNQLHKLEVPFSKCCSKAGFRRSGGKHEPLKSKLLKVVH